MSETLGKKAEKKIKEWLDRPEAGYDFNRIPDQLSGRYGSKNMCDFTLFLSPYNYYIESKATEADRFDFSMISDYQYEYLIGQELLQHPGGLGCDDGANAVAVNDTDGHLFLGGKVGFLTVHVGDPVQLLLQQDGEGAQRVVQFHY